MESLKSRVRRRICCQTEIGFIKGY
uniref:Uncharacterized protein n=1 Tax=Rhizophora mucronata TaxID=61149 RepID=A0A2P2PAM9_RHIMU